MLEQTVRVSPRVTSFTVVCEACVEAHPADEWLASRVEGRLRLEDDHASVSCRYGHTLRVERQGRRVGARA
jgi:hypothetical protein